MTYAPWFRTSIALALAAPLALLACSDDGEGETLAVETSGPTSDPTTDPSTGDGDGDPSTTDPSTTDPSTTDPTTGDGDGDPTTTGDGDGDPTTTGDGDGDGDPGPVDTSTYSAVIMPGGLDRIVITRVNIDEPNCTRMVLWSPQNSDIFDITMPQDWAIEEVTNWKQGFCPMDLADPDTLPDGGTGTITFPAYDALGTYPCAINVDLELDMNSDPPSWTTWLRQGILVDGVNCG